MPVRGWSESPRSAFDGWLQAYGDAFEDPRALPELACPSCGSRSLAMVFVVERVGDERGIGAFWCRACLHGTFPHRTTIPDGGTVAEQGTRAVPNYCLVPEDGGDRHAL